MALLEPRRLIADEGLLGTLRFVRNLILQPASRRRIMTMRRTFRTHRQHLAAVAIVARKVPLTDRQDEREHLTGEVHDERT